MEKKLKTIGEDERHQIYAKALLERPAVREKIAKEHGISLKKLDYIVRAERKNGKL